MKKTLIPVLAAIWAVSAIPASADWNVKRLPVADRDEDSYYYADDYSPYDDDYDDGYSDPYYEPYPGYYYGNSYNPRRYGKRGRFRRFRGGGEYYGRPDGWQTRGGMAPNK